MDFWDFFWLLLIYLPLVLLWTFALVDIFRRDDMIQTPVVVGTLTSCCGIRGCPDPEGRWSSVRTIRTVVAMQMATTVVSTVHRSIGLELSVPAVSRWTVETRNSGKLRKWVRRHARLETCLRSIDVTCTATSR